MVRLIVITTRAQAHNLNTLTCTFKSFESVWVDNGSSGHPIDECE